MAQNRNLIRLLLLFLSAGLWALMVRIYSKNSHAALFAWIAALLCAGGFFLTENTVEINSIIDDGETVAACGTVQKISISGKYVTATMTDIEWMEEEPFDREDEGKPACINLLLDNVDDGLAVGQRLSFCGETALYDHGTNPGEFDYYDYYESLGIAGYMKCDYSDMRLICLAKPVSFYLYRFRQWIMRTLRIIAEEEDRGILTCLLTGDKSGLSDEQKELYQEGGIMHLLSLSGLHISLIGTGMFLILRKLTGSFMAGSILSGFFVFAYGMMAMGGPSMKRAVICYLFTITGRVLGKQSDMISAASLSGILLLWEHPLLLFQSGFIMMLCCLIGIGYILPAVVSVFCSDRGQERNSRQIAGPAIRQGEKGNICEYGKSLLARSVKGVGPLILSTVWLQVCSMASVLWFQGKVPVIGALVNLLTLPFLGLVLLSAFLGVLAYGILPLWKEPAAIFFLGPGHYLLSWYSRVLSFFSGLSFSSFAGGRPRVWQLVLVLLLLALFLWFSYSRLVWQHKGMPFVLGILIFPLLLLLLKRFPDTRLSLTFLDVGQGDGIVIELPLKQGVICVDGGSSNSSKLAEEVYEPYFSYEGIGHVDYWILTHPDKDHYSALLAFLQEGFPVDHLVLAECFQESEFAAELESLHPVEYVCAGDTLTMQDLTLKVLSPRSGYEYSDSNDGSVVAFLGYGDFQALLTGDASSYVEGELIASLEGISPDILKVSHHGSQTGSSMEFLSALSPSAAIVSAGRDNKYGHPHKEVVDRLEELGIPMINTAESGCIRVSSDGHTCCVRTFV